MQAGIKYLEYLQTIFKDIRMAVAAYNMGEGNLQKFYAGAGVPVGSTKEEDIQKVNSRLYRKSGRHPAGGYNANNATGDYVDKIMGDYYGGKVKFKLDNQELGSQDKVQELEDKKTKLTQDYTSKEKDFSRTLYKDAKAFEDKLRDLQGSVAYGKGMFVQNAAIGNDKNYKDEVLLLEKELSIENKSSTLLDTLLTFWPPLPPLLDAEKLVSALSSSLVKFIKQR